MSECGCSAEQTEQLERKTLLILLGINAMMFLIELSLGLIAGSTGLIADSLDMLADALVYGLALVVIGHGLRSQAKAARLSGLLQVILGVGVLVEVVRRMLFGEQPDSLMMVSVAGVALVANIICLILIAKHRHGGVHMRASWIFSTNDVMANAGVIISGVLVSLTASRFPDLIVGTLIAAVVVRGGYQILREASLSQEAVDG